MSKMEAKSTISYEFSAKATGHDGFEIEFIMDDSFKSWRRIARWNLHFRHWTALRRNFKDLFTKVLWRKLWRHSS